MYEVTPKDPTNQPVANLLQRVLDHEFGEGTPIGNALSGVVRDIYVQEFFGVPMTEADMDAAFAPVLEMAKAKYGG